MHSVLHIYDCNCKILIKHFETESSLVHVIANPLYDTKRLPEQVMIDYESDLWPLETHKMTFEPKQKNFQENWLKIVLFSTYTLTTWP